MKKVISIVSVVVLCLAIFAGCGSKEVNLSDAMTKINADYMISLQTLDSADDLNKYYNIDTADVKQFAAEIDSNNDAPVVIILVEAVDSAAADRVEAALTTYYNSMVSIYGSYTPDKLDMVKSCSVTKDGNFVSLIVSDNAEGMLEIYNSYIK